MAVMKTLAMAMENGAILDSGDREDARRQAWYDAIDGVYNPFRYGGVQGEERTAYRLGRQQYEETCHEEGIHVPGLTL